MNEPDIIREWLALDPRADWEATPDDFAEAIAALDRIEAHLAGTERARKAERAGRKAAEAALRDGQTKRDAAQRLADMQATELGHERRTISKWILRAEAAEAALRDAQTERDEANDDRDNWKAACDGWQMAAEGAKENREAAEARVQQLKAALAEIYHHVQMRRTSLHMDGTEMFSQPVLARINEIAHAALADMKEEA